MKLGQKIYLVIEESTQWINRACPTCEGEGVLVSKISKIETKCFNCDGSGRRGPYRTVGNFEVVKGLIIARTGKSSILPKFKQNKPSGINVRDEQFYIILPDDPDIKFSNCWFYTKEIFLHRQEAEAFCCMKTVIPKLGKTEKISLPREPCAGSRLQLKEYESMQNDENTSKPELP